MQTVNRVSATQEARLWIRKLKEEKGDLLFHQSGGCCDGSAPMCYPASDFIIGPGDVLLGEIEGVPVYMGGQQFVYWSHTHLILDLIPGRGASFSLEAPYGVRFLTRSRLLEESDYLD